MEADLSLPATRVIRVQEREKNGDRVFPVINFSDKPVKVTLKSKYYTGTYKELFSEKEFVMKGEDVLELRPWEYVVLVK